MEVAKCKFIKAKDLSMVKALREFVKECFNTSNFCMSTSEVSKAKDKERGNYSLSLSKPTEEIPELFDQSDYAAALKKKLSTILKKEIAWFNICWSYQEEEKTEISKNIGSIDMSIDFRISN